MKRKLLALATTFLMLLSLVGCSSEGTALMKEMEKVSAWEATEQAGSMSMDMTLGETKVKLGFDYTAYTVSKDLKMEMTVTPKSLEMDGASLDLTKGKFKLSPVKLYMDGVKFYMSSSYLKEVCALAGADASQVVDVTKDYVAFDMTDFYKEMGLDIKELAKENSQSIADTYAKLDDVKLPIKQEGRKYTIELSADEMVSAGVKMLAKSLEAQKDVLTAEYKAAGLTEEQIKAAMDQVSAMTSSEAVKEFTAMIKGSTAKVVLTYEDDKQTTDLSTSINVTVEDQKVAMNFSMKDTAKKAAKKAITMPTSVTTYTMNDLMNAATAAEEVTTTPAAAEKDATATTNKAA